MHRVGLIAAIIVLLDQLTKWCVLRFVYEAAPVEVIPGFFHIVNWRNTGAAWGILRDYNTVLAIFSVFTVAAIYFFRHTFGVDRTGPAVALGLITGGIIGNVLDRLFHGAVVDFLFFFVGRFHWPAFNVADSGITVGVILYIICSWRSEEPAVT